jgi:hypothetical protein
MSLAGGKILRWRFIGAWMIIFIQQSGQGG